MNLKAKIQQGEQVLGTLISLPSPEVAELISHLDFDWLFFDMEHSVIDAAKAQTMLQAVGERLPVLCRLAELSESSIKKALDIGSAGVIIPKVNSAEEAKAAVRYAKYQPVGDRGVGAARAQAYGLSLQDYLKRANDSTIVVLQIEHIQGVENIEQIVEVDGVDVIFIGPYDLSGSLGLPGEVNHPKVLAAINRVEQVVKKKGLALGFFGMTPDAVKPAMEKGYQLITCGTEAGAIAGHMNHLLKKLKS